MPKSLLIVESPTKVKTLKSFLGPDFTIMGSQGHVRDLPKSGLSVDIEHDFTPEYELLEDRGHIIDAMRKAARNADHIYLASDPDREGEAIAWHIQEALKLKDVRRIEFNEITKTAVQRALSNPREIDMDRVNAQQARRVLDRIIGYQVSPLLARKIVRGLSAGRVQSVCGAFGVRPRTRNSSLQNRRILERHRAGFAAKQRVSLSREIADARKQKAGNSQRRRSDGTGRSAASAAVCGQRCQAPREKTQRAAAVHHQHFAAGSQQATGLFRPNAP